MGRPLAMGLLATLIAAGACVGGGGDPSTDPGGSVELTSDQLGDATLAGLGADVPAVDLADYRGRPVVVNFFASTCTPCVREMPALEEVHQAAGDDIAFIGVAVNDRVDDARELVRRTGVTYDLASDPGGEFFAGAGAVLLPTTLLLDVDGNVVRRLAGEITAESLVASVAEAVDVEVELS